MGEILAAWRRAERLTDELPEGSPERAAALAASQRMRDLDHELVASVGTESDTDAHARTILADLAEPSAGAAVQTPTEMEASIERAHERAEPYTEPARHQPLRPA